MTQAEREEIRKRVENEIKTLRESIDTLTDLTSDDEVEPDVNDWFTTKESNPGKDINELALSKAKQRLRILNVVLNRIDSKDYGICTVCKKPIPFERMKAVPTATRCIKC
ncbi:MAG: TraR/DksA family transcriptional regulator [Bacteroidales bacterium]|nr:TraR/DksA family transcriptional regulator [Bacteroidales bacterium]